MTQASYSLRRWADVITYGNKIADKNQPRLPFMLAKAFYEEEDYGQAEGLLKKALTMDSTNIETLTLIGKVYIDLNNYNKAIFYYNKALQIDPSNANLTYEYGLLNFTSNKPKEAVKYFELAVEKGYKADLGYLENLGMAYLSFDDAKGIEILNKVLQKKPNDSQILWQIAENYYRNKKYQAASEAFFNMYQIDATNVKALYMMGVVLQKSGDKTRGISVCEEAIRLDPSLAEMKKLIFAR
jgi:Tfp pilus assembly protein PilF